MPHTEGVEARGRLGRALIQPIQAFVHTEAAGGMAVFAAALVAFVWANSPWDERYFDLWAKSIAFSFWRVNLDETVGHLVSDGLMALFFLVIGLETKRELVRGELAGVRRAALPVAGALGGIMVPAGVYLALNAGGDGADGWGIPIATDIVFALGVLALLGSRAPFALKVFLLGLAVVDDIGAILVIAVFYTDSLSLEASLWAMGVVAAIVIARRAGVRALPIYVLLGVALWFAVLKSGVHATIAGVALAMLTPSSAEDESEPPLERLERVLHPWVVFAVVPLFVLASAGIRVTSDSLEAAGSSAVSAGVFLGLVVGKPVGILLATWLAVRLGLAALPGGVGWRQMAGAAVLGGIGFTVSLFVTALAFEGTGLAEEARIAIFAGSAVAAVAGYVFLRFVAGEFPDPGREGER